MSVVNWLFSIHIHSTMKNDHHYWLTYVACVWPQANNEWYRTDPSMIIFVPTRRENFKYDWKPVIELDRNSYPSRTAVHGSMNALSVERRVRRAMLVLRYEYLSIGIWLVASERRSLPAFKTCLSSNKNELSSSDVRLLSCRKCDELFGISVLLLLVVSVERVITYSLDGLFSICVEK